MRTSWCFCRLCAPVCQTLGCIFLSNVEATCYSSPSSQMCRKKHWNGKFRNKNCPACFWFLVFYPPKLVVVWKNKWIRIETHQKPHKSFLICSSFNRCFFPKNRCSFIFWKPSPTLKNGFKNFFKTLSALLSFFQFSEEKMDILC